jgi:hypothetical protein
MCKKELSVYVIYTLSLYFLPFISYYALRICFLTHLVSIIFRVIPIKFETLKPPNVLKCVFSLCAWQSSCIYLCAGQVHIYSVSLLGKFLMFYLCAGSSSCPFSLCALPLAKLMYIFSLSAVLRSCPLCAGQSSCISSVCARPSSYIASLCAGPGSYIYSLSVLGKCLIFSLCARSNSCLGFLCARLKFMSMHSLSMQGQVRVHSLSVNA